MLTMLLGMLMVALPALTAAGESVDYGKETVTYSSSSDEQLAADETETFEEPTHHIPILINNSVEAYIEYFRVRGKDMFQQWLDKSARYLPLMKEIFRNENLPEELAYVAMIESGFDPDAVSRANAAGPWQFMPYTAREYGLKRDFWVDERKDQVKSTLAAAQLFKDLHDRFGSWPLVLAAYNAGIGKVQRAMLKTGSDDFWDLKESAYLRRETKGFVPKFMAASILARDPAAYGFQVPDDEPLRYDQVIIQESMDLGVVAYCTDSTFAMIKSLNPEIKGRFTPPDVPHYLLKIPEGKIKIFMVRSAAIREAQLRIPWEERISIPLFFTQVGYGRRFGNGPDICSTPEKMMIASKRSYQPVEHGDGNQHSDQIPMITKETKHNKNQSKACVSRIQPENMRRRSVPFFSDTEH